MEFPPRVRLSGPLPALPEPLDRLAERWARLAPRPRLALVTLTVVILVLLAAWRLAAADQRWGGEPVGVLVAVTDLPVGAQPRVEQRSFPPVAVPPDALRSVPDGAVLALALPEGSVLTTAHLSAGGPAAGLAADLRVLPIAVEEGWEIKAGGRVDVWLVQGERPALLVGAGRPVLALSGEDEARPTALVGLAADEVQTVVAGLERGTVLLTHVPSPDGSPAPPLP
ncbi:MAG: hypothetical protein ACR2MA_02765 [Egibacteraceae bacterium]